MEDRDRMIELVEGWEHAFTAGMGGGTGDRSGAGLAQIARSLDFDRWRSVTSPLSGSGKRSLIAGNHASRSSASSAIVIHHSESELLTVLALIRRS